MLISLIVPCYNEEEAMPLFYQEAARVAAQMEKSHGAEFEIICVDDGSKDGTLRVARELHDADPRVRYVSFSRNFGKEAGIYAGLKAAKGDYVATLDADLQDPPALLPDMLDALLTGDYDCAATRRTTREGEPPVRSWFARLFYRIINKMSDTEIVDGARDFRLMSRHMVDAVLEMSGQLWHHVHSPRAGGRDLLPGGICGHYFCCGACSDFWRSDRGLAQHGLHYAAVQRRAAVLPWHCGRVSGQNLPGSEAPPHLYCAGNRAGPR